MEPSDCPRCLIRSCVYFKPSLLTIHLKTDRSSWLNCAGLEVYIYIIRTITLLFAPLSAHLCPPSPEIKHSTCTFTCCSSVFCHKYTHTPTHGCEAHVLSATNRNRGVRPTSTTLWHHHRACSLILQPQSPGISPPHPVIEQPHRLAAVSVNAAPSVKQPLGNVNTHRERGGGEIQQLFALTADDCPWFWCFSEAENLAQRHAPFHIHSVVFDGSKFRRESRRSSVQRRRDRLTTAPLKQPVP